MLGIHAALDFTPPWWRTVGYYVAAVFVSDSLVFAWLRRYLAQVRSFEGRQLLMEGPLSAFIHGHYREGRDFVIRHIRGPVNSHALKEVEFWSAGWLATLHQLGCATVADLAAVAQDHIKPEIRVVAQEPLSRRRSDVA